MDAEYLLLAAKYSWYGCWPLLPFGIVKKNETRVHGEVVSCY